MIGQKKKQESLLDLQWVRRALLLALFDIAIIIASSLLALFARFDFSYAQIEVPYLSNLYHYLLNGRTVYPFKSTAGNTDVVIFTWHTCQLSILNVRLYIKEYTAIPL